MRADFKAQSAYWDEFRDSAAQKASNTVYDSFLKSNGQELGMQSYGACVNLLVHYYIDEAREALDEGQGLFHLVCSHRLIALGAMTLVISSAS